MNKDYFGNIVVYNRTSTQDLKERLKAFRCPYCRSIFTIELEPGHKWRSYRSYTFGCPVCNIQNNWCSNDSHITLTEYKFLRWWFGVRDKWIKRKS